MLTVDTMSILIYISTITLGVFFLLIGAFSLRVSRKKKKIRNKVTYGKGIDKHLYQTGITIEHGMVVNKSHQLKAQSKISESSLEEMLVK